MPSHWGHRRLNIPSQSSATGTQCLHAVGCAEAGVIYERVDDIPDREAQLPRRRSHLRLDRRRRDQRRRVLGVAEHGVHAASCRSSTSSKTTATRSRCRWKCRRRAATSRALVEHFPGLRAFRCDGTDYLASYRTHAARPWRTCARARDRRSSTPRVIRPYSHSLSDDEKLYKTPAEREAEARRDPLLRMRHFLKTEGLATDEDLADILASVEREVNAAAEQALAAPKPEPDTATLYVFSPDVDPTSSAFATEPQPEGAADTMVAAINATLRDEMARDPRIVVFGEDVADASREEVLGERRRQGRRVQGHARPAAALRQRPRLQLAAGRGQHHRPRRRHGAARAEAGRRDPVLRLHLAGVHADSRRDGDDALPVEQQLVVPDGHPRADRRLPARRRAVPQPVGRRDLRALPRHPHRLSRRTRRTRPACCARRSAATIRCCSSSTSICTARPTTRATYPGPRLHDAVRQGRGRARGHRRRRLHLGRAGAALAARGAAGRARRHQRRGHRSAHDHSATTGRRLPRTRGRPAACSSRTRTS